MIRELRQLCSRRYLASSLLLMQMAIRRQYRNTFLGMGWSLIQPFAYISVLAVVMSLVIRFPTEHYAAYLISGMIPWQFMVSSITQASGAFTNRRSALHHTILPRTLFVVADVGMNGYIMFNTFALGIVAILLLKGFSPVMLLLPVALLPLVLFTLSISIAVAYLTPYFYDIPHLVGVAFQVLFWSVPVVYPLEAIPPAHLIYFKYNPLYLLIHPVQMVLYEWQVPSPLQMIAAMVIALVASVVSYGIYRLMRKNVIYYL